MAANRRRDAEKEIRLKELGWRVFTVWQCQLRSHDAVAKMLNRALQGR
jgi:DNA mismatch endonuclease (patch repair protein)